MGKSYCIFSANYLPNNGGVERYTYYLAKNLIKKGNTVTVVTSNVFKLKEHEIIDGIEIYRIPCFNVLKGRFPILKKNKAFKKINSELIDKSFDFVVVNTRFYFHSLYGVELAAKQNIPCITIEHGTAHLTVKNKILDSIGERFEHGITKKVKKYCKDYYGVSEACCEWSAHFGIESKGVLYNSVDADEIEEIANNTVISYRKEYNIPSDATVITFTGRLVEEKGFLKLIEAIKQLNLKNTWLFIAGDGPLYENLLKIKPDWTIALGKIDFEHIISLLKESDVFCLPSESEGFSTSVLEAVATKCFVITTSRGGSKELITGKEYGIIMESNSVEEIKHALTDVLSDDNYRISAVEKSYQRLIENNTWDKTTNKLISIAEEMSNESAYNHSGL